MELLIYLAQSLFISFYFSVFVLVFAALLYSLFIFKKLDIFIFFLESMFFLVVSIFLFPVLLALAVILGLKNRQLEREFKNNFAADVRSDSNSVVHMIHGTFEPTCAWANPDSGMSSIFENKKIDKKIFNWSGANTENAREAAASRLIDCIKETRSAEQYLVAHSHGGYVAYKALCGLGQEISKVKGVFLLSTPFILEKKIIRKGKYFSMLQVFGPFIVGSAFLFILLCLVNVAANVFYLMDWLKLSVISVNLYAAFKSNFVLIALIPFLVSLVYLVVLFIKPKFASNAEKKDANDNLIGVGLESILRTSSDRTEVKIITSSGDEADGLLRFVALLNEMGFRVTGKLNTALEFISRKDVEAKVRGWNVKILLYFSLIFSVGVFMYLMDLKLIDIVTVLVMLVSIVLLNLQYLKSIGVKEGEMVILPAAMPIAAAMSVFNYARSIAFGNYKYMKNLDSYVFTSETPEGEWSVFKVAPESDNGLVHATHSNESVFIYINKFFENKEDKQKHI